MLIYLLFFFFFSSRRRHTRCSRDWSSDVCSSDLVAPSHNEPDLGRCMFPQPASAGGVASTCTAYARYRSGERRVGEEGRSRWAPDHLKKKKKKKNEEN